MTRHNQQIGAWGEDTAADYLKSHGHEIIARNVRTPYGEIDIITNLAGITVFVEVKTLTSSKNILPEHNITPRKRAHMINAAQYYADEHEVDNWQIDVIAIEGKPGNTPIITYFENAIT